ncbi:MAG: vitamin K epoxide reductase family protein [Conexivisphaerales archaeon]
MTIKARSWRLTALLVAVPGLLSSIYLSYHAAFPQALLYCPTIGPFDCNEVTTSPYSMLFGVSVAYLGLAWFIVVVALVALNRTELLLPLWVLGAAFVAYLVGAEVFLVHSVCAYCTIAHASALLLGLPIYELLDAEV